MEAKHIGMLLAGGAALGLVAVVMADEERRSAARKRIVGWIGRADDLLERASSDVERRARDVGGVTGEHVQPEPKEIPPMAPPVPDPEEVIVFGRDPIPPR